DYKDDVRLSDKIIKQMVDAYRKIRNTIRFILGNISDFDPAESYDYSFKSIDKWSVLKLNELIEKVSGYYSNYEFYKLYHEIHNYCTITLSNCYLDVLKDRLYTYNTENPHRRAAQKVIYEVVKALTIMLSPVLSFTCEEIWKHVNSDNDLDSVFLADWPVKMDFIEKEAGLDEFMSVILKFREEGQKAMEIARNAKIIGHSLDVKLTVYTENEDFINSIEKYGFEDIKELLIISGFEIVKEKYSGTDEIFVTEDDYSIKIEKSAGEKCPRCWKYTKKMIKIEDVDVCEKCSSFINIS
ncbi:class I tRNA ligase family protein, partial [bacterium]|nr:class I tRNA ligase family protein [bacterium]